MNWKLSVVFCSIFLLLLSSRSIAANTIQLIVRGDDLGMTQGSIAAFEKAFTDGILTCGSIHVCAPWFEAAADLAKRNPKWCMGIHLTLIGEWRGYRWRPVMPWSQVSSLVDEDGFLFRFPEELWAKKPKIEEMEMEFRAQVRLALKKGVQVHYLDAHYMGYSSYPGMEELIQKLGKEFRFPVSGWMGEKRLRSIYTVPLGQKKEAALNALDGLTGGLWLWVAHPGIDSPEQQALVHTRTEDFPATGGVGTHRAEELAVLTSPELKSVILRKRIKLTNYKELQSEYFTPSQPSPLRGGGLRKS